MINPALVPIILQLGGGGAAVAVPAGPIRIAATATYVIGLKATTDTFIIGQDSRRMVSSEQ